jgi:hypothetical protein
MTNPVITNREDFMLANKRWETIFDTMHFVPKKVKPHVYVGSESERQRHYRERIEKMYHYLIQLTEFQQSEILSTEEKVRMEIECKQVSAWIKARRGF